MGSERCQNLPGAQQGDVAFEEEKPAGGRTSREKSESV